MAAGERYDVAILGGGLAGGCLARQLRLEAPALRVLVVEKRRHPVREAAFKVGESSVEIGAHYFQKRLGLEPHLRSAQLEKLGLRYFFTRGDNRDLATRVELGPAHFPLVPSFQLDRGRLENFLLRENAAQGVTVLDGFRVRSIALDGPSDHRATIAADAGGGREIAARWIVDASGRASQQLGGGGSGGSGTDRSRMTIAGSWLWQAESPGSYLLSVEWEGVGSGTRTITVP